ncbi:MAG TPA: hypothetical protein VNE71_06825 [Myxococcota bacterium]|nr:hypothetical protein [Myxococcota bacterium]
MSDAPAPLRSAWLLAAALAALWIVQFHPFVFPNNDFYSFRRAAWSFQRGELPASTKRGPIFPAAIALLAPVMPGDQPELDAALAMNLVCSLALFLALAAFAARTFPDAAPLFAVLLATTPVLHAAALQPLLEPSLGLFVALAFHGLRARSPWQYAAAGAAALSRPDAIVLVAILAAVNAFFERDRMVRHAALAAAAALPCLAWYSLGRSGGGAAYLALREAYGSGAPLYLAILPKELFGSWWRTDPLSIALFAVAVAAPSAWGAWRAWRTAPRETAAMLAWFAVSCAVVVLYGVGKTRYVHPIAWVPLLCLAIGVVDLLPRAAARLRALPTLAPPIASILAWIAILGAVRAFVVAMGHTSGLAFGEDLVFALLAFATLVVVLNGPSFFPPDAANAASLLALTIVLPLVLGGVGRKLELLAAVHDFDRAAVAAADWVRTELPPGERIAALHYSQIKFAAGPARERVVPFRRFEAATAEELRAALAREGVRYLAWTWRRPAETKAERFYAGRRNEALAAAFATGEAVPGFEHVATLPAEPRLHQPPAQIYRLAEE